MIRLHYWEVNRNFYEVKNCVLKRNIVLVKTKKRGCWELEFKKNFAPSG